jgi:D-alanyl-lipoteichoic acid acyltransferase DltB (MBOAT superfamily)
LIEVVCYVFFFPAFLAGPIERFPAFIAQKNPGSTPAVEINYGLYRITRGVLKKVFLADTLLPVIVPFLQNPAGVNRGFLLVSLYALAVQIYLDFSGYTDIAVGSARLFGYRIMENFDRPFFKTTIAQFWRSWHMSLYTWIRDYFFFPVFGRKASRYSLYAGLFCTMLVFNLWHGFTARFIVLGVYHGVLLAGWQAFRELKQRIPFLRQMTGSPPLDAVSAFLTFNAVSFGFMLFVCDIPQAGRLIKRLAGLC